MEFGIELKDFLGQYQNGHTRRAYGEVLHKFQDWCQEEDRAADLDAALAWLQTTSKNLGSRNVRTAALRKWFTTNGQPEQLVRKKLNFRPYEAPRQPVVPFEWRDRILAQAQGPFDKCFLTLLFYTGLRGVGLQNLRWGGVDFEALELETVEKRNMPRTKDSKLGPVYVRKACAEALVELLELHKEIYSEEPLPEDRVFPISGKTMRRILQDAMKAAGLYSREEGKRGPGLHSVRRGVATNMLQRLEADDAIGGLRALEHVRRTLSHTDLRTTLKYLYIERDAARKAYDRAFGSDGAP